MLSFTQCTIYSDSQSLFVNAFHIIQLVYIFTMIMMAEFAFKRTDQCVMHTEDIIRNDVLCMYNTARYSCRCAMFD